MTGTRTVLREGLRPSVSAWEWQTKARCRTEGSSAFFSPARETSRGRVGRETRAKAICNTCPVLRECRRHAMTVREPYGVWGGLTEGERKRQV